jgi:hypothetical protein
LLAPAGISWLWLVPVISLATACVAASVMPGVLWKPLDPHPYDVISYHLQVPREWYEMGKIVPLSHNVFSFFPFNVEMQYLLLMHAMRGPWNAMYACQFLSVIYAALMVIAVASEGGVVGAAIVSCVPWVIMLAGVAYVESALMFYTALSVIWAMRSNRNLILAGIMAGLACGVKITAVPMLLFAIPIAMLLTTRKIFFSCVVFVVVGLLVLSPWLIRNLVWAGNPIFPVAMRTLGRAHFSDEQVERFDRAHSAKADSIGMRLKSVWSDVLAHRQYGYILLPLAIVAAIVRWRDRETWLLLIVGAIIFVTWIGFTHLQPRFLIMIVPVAAILAGRIKFPAMSIVILLAAGIGWSAVYSPLARITRDPVRSAFIGVQNFSFMIPPELTAMENADKQVGLVGDAGAFLYQIPMSRLHYRTVFDVPGNVDDPIEAWVGKVDANWLLVINPSEVERLHRTYWKIPALPPVWAKLEDQPFVLRGAPPQK